MTTHTPGKWNVETWTRNNGQSSEIVIVSNKTDAVASACPLWRPNGTIDQAREEEAANARLIAAAPELLEALKGLMKEAVKLAESQPDNAPIWAWIDDASDAITKAER